LLLIAFSILCLSHRHAHHHDHDHDHNDDLFHNHDDDELLRPAFFHRFRGTETINGVPPEVRLHWMQYAMNTKILSSGSPCPRGAFGAVIVNRTTNALLCETNQTTFTDATDHAEMHVIRQCAQLFNQRIFPGAGTNRTVWAETSLYTTGESCPMCQSAQVWVGVGETIYSTTIEFLDINLNQIDIPSKKVVAKGIPGGLNPPLTLISFVNTSFTDQYFAWQNMPGVPCPGGCERDDTDNCVPPARIA